MGCVRALARGWTFELQPMVDCTDFPVWKRIVTTERSIWLVLIHLQILFTSICLWVFMSQCLRTGVSDHRASSFSLWIRRSYIVQIVGLRPEQGWVISVAPLWAMFYFKKNQTLYTLYFELQFCSSWVDNFAHCYARTRSAARQTPR